MTEEKKIQEEIIILKEAVANISRENKELHEWTLRALHIDSAIKYRNLKRLIKIKRYIDYIYKRIKDIDLDDYGQTKAKLKKIKEHLSELNLY